LKREVERRVADVKGAERIVFQRLLRGVSFFRRRPFPLLAFRNLNAIRNFERLLADLSPGLTNRAIPEFPPKPSKQPT
jgi:hypothetical protein